MSREKKDIGMGHWDLNHDQHGPLPQENAHNLTECWFMIMSFLMEKNHHKLLNPLKLLVVFFSTKKRL
jgi:hypothetical protein